MTDSKKKGNDKGGSKAKKLKLSKETIKDLTAKGGDQVKGGIPARTAPRTCDHEGC